MEVNLNVLIKYRLGPSKAQQSLQKTHSSLDQDIIKDNNFGTNNYRLVVSCRSHCLWPINQNICDDLFVGYYLILYTNFFLLRFFIINTKDQYLRLKTKNTENHHFLEQFDVFIC